LEQLNTVSLNSESATLLTADKLAEQVSVIIKEYDGEAAVYEIAVWLSGIKDFGKVCDEVFVGEDASTDINEVRRQILVTGAALVKLTNTLNRLRSFARREKRVREQVIDTGVSLQDLDQVASALRRLISINTALLEGQTTIGGNASWHQSIKNEIGNLPITKAAPALMIRGGRRLVPEKLFNDCVKSISSIERVDIENVINCASAALLALEIIGRMHAADEPMKTTLPLFAAIREQTRQMVEHINNRLTRLGDEQSPLFCSLDTASYSASLELKKVFQQELRGIVTAPAPTTVYARVETAYSLLLDSYQQILVELARLSNPNASPFDYFPRYEKKLNESLKLRQHLWKLIKANQNAESDANEKAIEALKGELYSFNSESLKFLHYKDSETFERFYEEINASVGSKDLAPILHRFGRYLETLFGQVSMRGVLVGHPFDEKAAS
jgi:hypothetical protein